MSVEENKELMRRCLDAFNSGDVQGFEEFFSSDHKHTGRNGKVVDHQRYMETLKKVMSSTPLVLDDLMAEGDRVVSWVTFSEGDQTSHVHRFVNGKIVETWSRYKGEWPSTAKKED